MSRHASQTSGAGDVVLRRSAHGGRTAGDLATTLPRFALGYNRITDFIGGKLPAITLRDLRDRKCAFDMLRDCNRLTQSSTPLLHLAISRQGIAKFGAEGDQFEGPDLIRDLLKISTIDIHQLDSSAQTALHRTVAAYDFDTASTLVAMGIDCSVKDNSGKSAFDQAYRLGEYMLTMLRERRLCDSVDVREYVSKIYRCYSILKLVATKSDEVPDVSLVDEAVSEALQTYGVKCYRTESSGSVGGEVVPPRLCGINVQTRRFKDTLMYRFYTSTSSDMDGKVAQVEVPASEPSQNVGTQFC